MPKQPAIHSLRDAMKKKLTRRELLAPHYPKAGAKGGRPPMPLEVMLRVYFLQNIVASPLEGLIPRQHFQWEPTDPDGDKQARRSALADLAGSRGKTVVRMAGKTDALSRSINALRGRRSVNRMIVAVANKGARIIGAMLRKV